MPLIKSRSRRTLALSLLLLAAFSLPALAQKDDRAQKAEQADDVVRVTTELVQTEIMVFDKRGSFVDGLSPEQFELTLEGTKQPVSFFERVRAGSASEAAQLAAARKSSAAATKPTPSETLAADRGRVIIFFVDDLHLSGASAVRAREALRHFVGNQMSPNDQVAIASASGRIGFLQQLTDNPAVLREAIARIGDMRKPEAYNGRTRVSEYMASQIMDNGNKELFTYLMEAIKLEMQAGPGSRHGDHRLGSSKIAGAALRNNINQVYNQARMAASDTLDALRNLMLSAAQMPGRKLVFFISDGFVVSEHKVGTLEALRGVTDAAARAGVVVYSLSLRENSFGLGSGVDASTNDYVDTSSRKAALTFGELAAAQQPLRTVADETGGRAILNPDSLNEGIRDAIRETSDYYVLAWRPATTEQREGRLRLKVSIKDRPDLRVRLRNTLYEPPQGESVTASGKAKEKAATVAAQSSPEAQLLGALGAFYPQRAIPVSLSAGYAQAAGPVLKLSMQTERAALDLDPQGPAKQAFLDVVGAAIDDRGIIVTFKQVVSLAPDSAAADAPPAVVWNQQLNVKPGLYQVRVAVRERATGRTGSAQQWIEIPDAARAGFHMSSIFLGERKGERGAHAEEAGQRAVTVDVDHKFARTSALRFQAYVYNARGPVWIRAQVLRHRQQVMTLAPAGVPMTGDPARLPYWAEIALDKLPAGHYTLQVSATDETGKATAPQRVNFSVE